MTLEAVLVLAGGAVFKGKSIGSVAVCLSERAVSTLRLLDIRKS